MAMVMPVRELLMFFVGFKLKGEYYMLIKLGLYVNTIKLMKASQIYYRIRKILKFDCSIGCKVTGDANKVEAITAVSELDFDQVFIKRFIADEILADKITFLHTSKYFCWNEKWHFDDKSALWNFNLHYFDFLFSIIDAYRKTGERKYLDKSKEIIKCWIDRNNQKDGGEGWSPYTIDLRLTNWLSYYSYVNNDLDAEFKEKLINSIREQYVFLSRHLEKDILGNHYFEDLKTLVLCALFFNDMPTLDLVLKEFYKECKEEILPDGMHFELSPMYHKLILEGIIRVAVALKGKNRADVEVERYLQPMLDVAWSLEEGLERVPLFNDSGNNVSKSIQSLIAASKNHFDIQPIYKSRFEDSGFYIFKQGAWKLIVDAGQPGPSYIPGHAHCDAGSFELFKDGKPVIVNCGTYAYQCKERRFFRSTAAHNTVMINNTEQSQCWGAFRMAKRGKISVKEVTDKLIVLEMTDQKNNIVTRTIRVEGCLTIVDKSEKNKLTSFIHLADSIEVNVSGNKKTIKHDYAPEYGIIKKINVIVYEGFGEIFAYINL